MQKINKIILHWTAGTHKVSDLDREHYHFIVAGDGNVVPGKWPVSANEKIEPGRYAAHTLNCNTGSIGIAVAAMAGAVERPFDPGKYPITRKQVDALVDECAALSVQYGIPVTRKTILTHAEVQPTLGIKQRGKWDITWLPWLHAPNDPVFVGDMIRERIIDKLEDQPAPARDVSTEPETVEHEPVGLWGLFWSIIMGGMRK